MPVMLPRHPLRHRCWSWPVPDHCSLAVASLRPSVKQALRKIVEYNTRTSRLPVPWNHRVRRSALPRNWRSVLATGRERRQQAESGLTRASLGFVLGACLAGVPAQQRRHPVYLVLSHLHHTHHRRWRTPETDRYGSSRRSRHRPGAVTQSGAVRAQRELAPHGSNRALIRAQGLTASIVPMQARS